MLKAVAKKAKSIKKRNYSHGRPGYRVIPYKPEEIEMNRRMLACDARSEDEIDGEEGEWGES